MGPWSKDLQALQQRAKVAGVNVWQVCAKADIAPSTYSRWSRGEQVPGLDTWLRFKSALITACESAENGL
jgi:hypothetical protein